MSVHAYGEGAIYQRGKIWWVRYNQDGKQVRESSKSEKQGDAVKLLHKRQGAIVEGRPTGREGEKLTLKTLKELLHEDYVQRERKSWSRAGRSFQAVIDAFGENAKVPRLTADALHRYLGARLKDGAARATVQKELAAVKRALNIAVERGLLPYRVPFPRMGEIKNARCEFIEDFEWALVRAELPPYWQDMGDMALAMGWRVKGEIRPLKWAQVDWERGLLHLERYKTKNGDARIFPFTEVPEVLAALERRRTATPESPYVFHVPPGKTVGLRLQHDTAGPVGESRFYRDWRRGWRKAFGKDAAPKIPHDFRRSVVRALETGQVPRSVAKRLVGHRTDSMYSRYAITTEQDLRQAVRRLVSTRPGAVDT